MNLSQAFMQITVVDHFLLQVMVGQLEQMPIGEFFQKDIMHERVKV